MPADAGGVEARSPLVKRVSDADAQMTGGGGWVELSWVGATGQEPRKL